MVFSLNTPRLKRMYRELEDLNYDSVSGQMNENIVPPDGRLCSMPV